MRKGVILVISFLFLYFFREVFQEVILQISEHLSPKLNKVSQFPTCDKSDRYWRLYQSQLIRLQEIERENKRLRELLNWKHKFNSSIPASVIGRAREEISDILLIDRGEKQGVVKNSAVITPGGLIGIVEDVKKNFAQVITCFDPRFQISARVASTREVGFLIGRGRGKSLELLYLSLNTNSKPGDIVLTSGEGILPKGIVVGRVTNIFTHSSQLYKIAKIQPFVDVNKVEEVLVITR